MLEHPAGRDRPGLRRLGIGYLVGALLANRLSRRFGVGPTIILGAAGSVSLLLLAAAPTSNPIPFLIAAQAISSMGIPIYNITQVSFRQAITPERLQGRMNSVMRFIVWGVMPLGALLGGALASWFGLRTAIWVGAIGMSLAVLPVLLSPVRTLREMPEPVDEPLPSEAEAAGGLVPATAGAVPATPPTDRGGAVPFVRMPELPEVEAWVRELDPLVSAAPVLQAGPAHIATLKTFDPPLRELEGRRFAGAGRRGKWLLFPTADGALQLRVHLMSAGRIRHLAAGAKGPKTPAFRLRFENGGELVLTEAGPKKRAGVWLESPEQTEAELAHLGPEALGLGVEELREILAGDNRRLHSLLRDQRALAGIGRAHANEILHRAQLSPFALSGNLDEDEIERLAAAIEEDLTRALELRLAGQGRQGRLPRAPAPRRAVSALRRAAAAGRLRGAHGLLLRALPDRRPGAEGPPHVAAAEVAQRRVSSVAVT